MWEYYTWRDYQRRRKAEEKRKRAKQQRLEQIKLSRFDAKLRPAGALQKETWTVDARFMNLDFTPRGVRLFTSTPFAIGTLLSMTFTTHQPIYLRGRVVGCERKTAGGPIYSDHDYSFRIILEFAGTTQAADESVKEFAQDFFDRYCLKPAIQIS